MNIYYVRDFVDQESMQGVAVPFAQGFIGCRQGVVRLKELSGAQGSLLSSHGCWKNSVSVVIR